MTIEALETACLQQKAQGQEHLTLVFNGPFPRKGWPRGELLCAHHDGRRVYLFRVDKLLALVGHAKCEREAFRVTT